ncbi:ferric reduction oxidase 2-like protein [Cinnamomum micranthum f. kanehirae]|uniref:ferric-chelate reductase (NADH) n=1 Tax=Cinnamomum micranthum f. kanehirae TaxID=337451 RepID=A0A3S3PFC3_9MAGN|nr:ferric reduction oxidase 2-like protein [Cinnamomum micranthum f. kanehirae]
MVCDSFGNNHLLALWRRPVLVKGPLGIVSATELAFSAMFMALLIWSFSTYLYTGFSNIQLEKEGEQVWEAKLSSAALRLGLVGSVCCAFLFFPVTRGSSILPLIGLTSEGSIKYHIWLGHIVMILFTAHGLCYIIYWASTNQISQMLTWDKIDVANVPGELALLSGLVMWITSLPSIRRKMFEIFYYTHHLYPLFLFFFLLHVHISFFCLILPGVYLFLIDRYLRFLQSRRKVPLVSARILPCQTIELNLSKSPGLSYGPLSIVFINVPSISSLQWHPFTVSSNSNMDQDHLSVIVKAEGSWSQKLYQMISSPSRVECMHVSVEGPYGPTSAHFLSHEMLVMVSGGSGLTPFISIIRELIYRRTTSGGPSPRLLLICAFKNSSDLSILDLLLPISGTNSAISLLKLRIEAFITREKEPPTDAPKSLQTIWFSPGNSDEPIFAVLGPSSWLWLGIIISTSFVMFLLLLGILTHYYIHPIDHNTDMVYSNLSRSLLNMLFICVSIFATSSVVELWNRKQRVMEAKQIQNMEMEPTPTSSSPGSWFYSADRELESLPREPLIEATITNVHYGARPDLKKLILECQGSSIGVLASGPREMRHDVATICSSGLAHNLHFESISFSW